MARRRTTLKDVAEAVGVHLSTVSRALDPRTRHMITDPLAARILQTADRMGYVPDPIAAGLRTGRTRIIGVVVPDITNPIFPPMVRGIEDVLAPRNYVALVVNTDNDIAAEARAVEMLRGRGTDGIVVASAARQDAPLTKLLADNVPLVAVNRVPENTGIPAVLTDDAAGMTALVDHLAALGHKRIAHLAGPVELSTGWTRLNCFLARVRALGLSDDPALIAQTQRYAEAEGQMHTHRLLEFGARPTAIVAGNDLLALGALTALAARGLRCPEDLSVTGYNDMPLMDRISPPLTTVRIDTYASGRHAAAIVLHQIETGIYPEQRTLTLPVHLTIRASTGAPVCG
jgi:LacI family transcriptional regulator